MASIGEGQGVDVLSKCRPHPEKAASPLCKAAKGSHANVALSNENAGAAPMRYKDYQPKTMIRIPPLAAYGVAFTPSQRSTLWHVVEWRGRNR